jgi:ribosome-associated protein
VTRTPPSDTALLCVKAALEKKAYDLVLLDVSQLTSLADSFLICTGRSDTQVQAICQSIEATMKAAGHLPLAVEGYQHGHWIVLDYGDIVAHIFFEPVRDLYDLERLWSKASRVQLPEPFESQARDLQLAPAARASSQGHE